MLQSPCGIEQVTTLRVRDALLAGLAQFPRLLAACRAGDTLMVTKLDRLARSLPDANDILDEHTKRNIKLSVGR